MHFSHWILYHLPLLSNAQGNFRIGIVSSGACQPSRLLRVTPTHFPHQWFVRGNDLRRLPQPSLVSEESQSPKRSSSERHGSATSIACCETRYCHFWPFKKLGRPMISESTGANRRGVGMELDNRKSCQWIVGLSDCYFLKDRFHGICSMIHISIQTLNTVRFLRDHGISKQRKGPVKWTLGMFQRQECINYVISSVRNVITEFFHCKQHWMIKEHLEITYLITRSGSGNACEKLNFEDLAATCPVRAVVLCTRCLSPGLESSH